MASAVCEHCMAPMAYGEAVVCKEGFSYHKKCKKCYVCSETDLHNAEIFQGVIFCAACAKRIFQGCSTARRAKSKPRRRRTRRDRREQGKRPNDMRVIERARLACSGHSTAQETSTDHDISRLCSSFKPEPRGVEADPARPCVRPNCYCVVDIAQRATDIMRFFAFQSPKQLKQNSADHGINTDASNALLNDQRYPIKIDCDPKDKVSTLEELQVIRQKKLKKKKEKNPCSDMRMAELGASTEIASMALRKQSDLTYQKSFNDRQSKKQRDPKTDLKNISERLTNSTSLAATPFSDTGASHSGVRTRQTRSTTTRTTRSESVVATDTGSDNSAVEWVDSVCNKYRVLSEANRHWFTGHLGSIITLPFKLFKKNIMMRSSLVSVIINNEAHKRLKNKEGKRAHKLLYSTRTFFDRIKMLFNEEIPKHRERGIRRLYSTINKRRTPYKLGWLKYQDRTTKTLRPKYECLCLQKRCKHFHASHSYRCMRAQVMRLAGPTKSEMRRFRRRVKNSLVPPWWHNTKFSCLSPSGNRCSAGKTSEACGAVRSSSQVEPKYVRSI